MATTPHLLRPLRCAAPGVFFAYVSCRALLCGAGCEVGSDGTCSVLDRSQAPWRNPVAALNDHAYLRERVKEEHGWSEAKADGQIVEYLRFLHLLAQQQRMELVASSDVDLIWHEHLQDTYNYASDCQRLFGRFLHHRRARTSDEVLDLPDGYARTKRRYAEVFGVDAPHEFWGDVTESMSMCGGSSPGPAPAGQNQPIRRRAPRITTTVTTTMAGVQMHQATCGNYTIDGMNHRANTSEWLGLSTTALKAHWCGTWCYEAAACQSFSLWWNTTSMADGDEARCQLCEGQATQPAACGVDGCWAWYGAPIAPDIVEDATTSKESVTSVASMAPLNGVTSACWIGLIVSSFMITR